MENTNKTEGKTSTFGEGVTETPKQKYIDAWQSYINPLYALCFNGNRELEGEIAKAIKTLYNNVERVADAKEKEGCDFGGAN